MESVKRLSAGRSAHVDEAFEPLLRHGWLSRRSPQAQAALLEFARLRVYEPGEVLYRAGDQGSELIGLISGDMEISLTVPGKPDVVVHKCQPGIWLGAGALLSRGKRGAKAIAVSRTIVVSISAERLRNILVKHPEMYADFFEMVHENFKAAERLLAEALSCSATERVARRLSDMAKSRNVDSEGFINISQGKIAAMVGASLPTVQRAIRVFKSAGYVDVRYGKIKVLDVVGLSEFDDAVE